MKRFLSILLSVMLLLGSLTVTVFAAPELSLVTTNTLAGINSAPFADAGKYVLFNKVDGAAYYVNGVEATVANGLRIDTPLNKADFVALKVANAGPNVFTAEVDGVASNSVNVYGVEVVTGTVKTSSSKNTLVDLETIEDADLKAALSERENVAYYGESSTSSYLTVATTDTYTYRIKNSVYINQDALNGYVGLPRVGVYQAIRQDLSIYLNSSKGSTSGGTNTGFSAVTHAWNDFEFVVNDYTSNGTQIQKMDAYFNNILIGKSVGSYTSKWYLTSHQVNATDRNGNVYHTRVQYSGDTIRYTPTLTAVADDENDTVIVTGTDVDEFTASQYAAKVFVNNVPTEDAVVINAEGDTAPTSITIPEAKENAEVYVAFVDENNNVLNAFEPVKSNSVTFESIAAAEMLTKLALSPVSDSTHIASLDGAMVGSKIRFNVVETLDGYTVKYFNNGTEVTPTVVSDGIITLPVTSASNSYVAKVYQDGVYVPGYDSDPVEVTGLNLASYPSMSAGSVRSSSCLTNTTPAEVGITGINGDDTVSIGTRASGYGYWTAETVFTDNPNYDEYLLTVDAYVKTNNGVLNNKDGEAVDRVGIYGLKNNSGTSAGAAQWLLIDKDGKVGFGGDSTISYETYTDYTVSLDAWHTYSVLIHKATGKLDLYVDGVLVAKDFLSTRGANLTGGPSVHAISASTNVVYLKRAFTGTLYDTVANPITEITADLATGEVVVPAVAVDEAYQAETIAVIGRKADDTVKVETFTFGEDASKTITLGAGYEQIFVWTWDDLVPLCDVIDE